MILTLWKLPTPQYLFIPTQVVSYTSSYLLQQLANDCRYINSTYTVTKEEISVTGGYLSTSTVPTCD